MSESTPTPTDPREENPVSQGQTDYGNATLRARIQEIGAERDNLAAEIAELKAKLATALEQRDTRSLTALERVFEIDTLRAELEAARKELVSLEEMYQRSCERENKLQSQRNTALAAKDAAEKERDELKERLAHIDDLTYEVAIDGAYPGGTIEKRVEVAVDGLNQASAAFNALRFIYTECAWEEGRGDDRIGSACKAALTPAPTQEPPAGGVTISNDSSTEEKHGDFRGPKTLASGSTPVSVSAGDASPAVAPLSNSPADVQSEGRGEWMPIETAPKDGTYILLLGDSGYLTTPWRVNVGAWKPGFRDAWVDHANDRITDGGTEPTHWLPLDAFMLPTEGSGAL